MKIPLLLSGIFAVVILIMASGQADASTPCLMYDLDRTWLASDNIYTGKVVEVTPQQPDHAQGDDGTTDVDPELIVRIDFELEHVLKGYPQHTSWQYHVPPETLCASGFCVYGADHYTLGSEIFYIIDSDGNILSEGGGACGIGTSKVNDGGYWTLPDDFFDHFEKIYGFPPPKDNPCSNPDHVLVLRENDRLACVKPSTAERKAWDIFNMKEYQSDGSSGQAVYDRQLSSKDTMVINGETYSEAEVALSNMPKVGETTEITMRYTHLHKYSSITPNELKSITVSPNFEFVGMDEENVHTHINKHWEVIFHEYVEPFMPLEQNQTEAMSATVRAVSEGQAWIAGGALYEVDPHRNFLAAKLTVTVEEDQTLLVKDHIRVSNPMPDMSMFKR